MEQVAAGLDEALAAVAALPAAQRQVATGAVDLLNELHREGLRTVVRRLLDDPRGKELLFELVDDPGVHMLLAMHGLVRADPEATARAVLDRIRPGLASHGGGVELSHLADGVAYVRLQGACNGCSMAAVTMRDGVEVALVEGVPGVSRVEVLPNDPAPTLIPVDSLRVRPAEVDRELEEAGWARAGTLADLPSGELRQVTLAPLGGAPVDAIVVNVDGQLTAYVDECAHQGLPLGDALVDAAQGTLTCPWHGFCYDATSGECLSMPGAQLRSLPLRIEGRQVWVRAAG